MTVETIPDKYKLEKAQIVLQTDEDKDNLEKEYNEKLKGLKGDAVEQLKQEARNAVLKLKENKELKLKELDNKWKGKSLKVQNMEDDVEQKISKRLRQEKYDKLFEEMSKKVNEACTGIDCLKEDVKKLQHNHDSKIEELKKNHDNKLDKLRDLNMDLGSKFEKDYLPKVKESCEGLECLKKDLKKISEGKLAVCDSCGQEAVPYLGSYCSSCGEKIQGWNDDQGEPIKAWKPTWGKFKEK